MLEVGDDRHHLIGRRRDVDAGAGLVRHEPYLRVRLVLGLTAYRGCVRARAPAQRRVGPASVPKCSRHVAPDPRRPISRARAGRPAAAAIRGRQAADDHRRRPGSQSRPSRTVSGAPPESPMITGSPQAAASRAARPSPSGFRPASRVRTGRANTVRLLQFGDHARPRGNGAGQIRTVSAQPQPVDHRARSRVRCGPSPTMISSGGRLRSAARPSISRQARSRRRQALLGNEPSDGDAARTDLD